VDRGANALFDGNLQRAEQAYRNAAIADPFSPDPVGKLAELLFTRWQSSPRSTEAEFQKAVEMQSVVIEQDPYQSSHYRRLGIWYAQKFKRSGRPADAQQAADWLLDAAELYPHSAALQAELANALDKAARVSTAQKHADVALNLEKINHREGHADKYLPEQMLKELKRISGSQHDGKIAPNRD
jgi:tetratricopeptide (TPR) repeat protein